MKSRTGLNRRPSYRSAFTFAELIVVVVIAVFLLLLLLPVVQWLRESSRRNTCSRNLVLIGKGLEKYHSTFGQLPVGDHVILDDSPDYGDGSVLVHLLPFLEKNDVFEAFDIKSSAPVDVQTYPDGKTIASTVIGVYVCPTDNNRGLMGHNDDSDAHYAVANYAATMGPTELANNPEHPCSLLDSWNSLAVGKRNPREFAGSFFRNPRYRLTFDDILDGRSGTIFFGEVRRECSWHIQRGWGSTNNGQGYVSTIVPINWDSSHFDATDGCYHPESWSGELGFKSMHPGGVNVLMGDGSNRFLDEEIDMQALQYLGGRADILDDHR